MSVRPLLPAILLLLSPLAIALVLRWLQRRGAVDLSADKVRRGTGHAFMGMQEFVQPSVEHVMRVEDVEERDDAGDDPDRLVPPRPFRS